MFIKIGKGFINTDNVAVVNVKSDVYVTVTLVTGKLLVLKGEIAGYFVKALDRLSSVR